MCHRTRPDHTRSIRNATVRNATETSTCFVPKRWAMAAETFHRRNGHAEGAPGGKPQIMMRFPHPSASSFLWGVRVYGSIGICHSARSRAGYFRPKRQRTVLGREKGCVWKPGKPRRTRRPSG
ncbi:uncharacterized protein LOC100994187 [Anopheles sinensis]|uniref:Uncharacterized protein LOC100994187 n=1 Tax=Anopheles sinensis TaxID=74873 RepID=A0A084VM17_ANOSI|nr:uncharacterized protein LOC100994187 [Anopheles sinensis]